MTPDIASALARGHTIDITTTGRRTGEARRIEIVFHNIDGHIVISGSPRHRTRAWIHNLEKDPRMTFHLKGPVSVDLPATARVISDPAERRRYAGWITANAWRGMDPDAMVEASPMIEVTLDDVAA